MARNVTMIKMLTNLRARARISKLPAHNIYGRDQQVEMLQNKLNWFWNEFDWPHMRVDRFLQLAAGQRFYDLPADLDIARIQHVAVRNGSVYIPVLVGITDRDYAACDSYLDVRQDPVAKWQISEDPDQPGVPQIEVWPVPETDYDPTTLDGTLKVTGIRNLNVFVDDTDTCDLDDELIVTHAAAEILAAKGAPDAQVKLDEATAVFARLKAGLMPRKVYSGMLGTQRGWRNGYWDNRMYAIWRPGQ